MVVLGLHPAQVLVVAVVAALALKEGTQQVLLVALVVMAQHLQ
jgi:hypothetical protein